MRHVSLAVVLSTLLACAGKDSAPPAAPSGPPTVVLTAPTAGQRVLGGTSFTVTGTVTGATSATVALNGGAAAPATIAGGTLSLTVNLLDGDNSVVVTATGPAGTTTVGPVTFRRVIPPAVAITSPAEGQRLVTGGPKAWEVRGTVTGDGVAAVTLTVNGVALPATPVTAGAFTEVVTLAPRGNTIAATATGENGTASAGPVNAFFPFLALTTGQAASLVLGQADFTSGAADRGAAVGGGGLDSPQGSAAWDGTRLFVPDYYNNRVLAWNAFPTVNGAAADWAIGQTTLTANAATPDSATGLQLPLETGVAAGKLYVTDLNDNRVVFYDPVPSGSGAQASFAVGRPDLTSGSGTVTCTDATLHQPSSAFVGAGKLMVADAGNSRVMVWNAVPGASGVAADVVLGQADFWSCGSPPPGASSFAYPNDAWTDGTRVFVADMNYSRVLGWSTFPAANGAPADLVLGQPDFATVDPTAAATGLSFPYAVRSNGNQLFVSDQGNNRVLVWNAIPTSSTAPADVVLGQGSMADGGAATSAAGLNGPSGLLVLDDGLVVTDAWNNRVLVFR